MILKNLDKKFLINSFLVLLIFLLDRLSKIYVIYLENKNEISVLLETKFINIHLIWNQGIAFGLLSFEENYLYNFLTLFIFIIILFISFMIFKSKGFKKYSLIMILGGAIGNFYDRVFYNAVPDFIDFHIGNFHWFIFNLADIFITIGVIFMILIELTTNNSNEKI